MKKILTFLLSVSFILVNAQIFDPVKWDTKVEKINDQEYDLVTTATIDQGWKLYSQTIPPNGPVPTTFEYINDGTFELVGKTVETGSVVKHDAVFDMEIGFFYKNATFKQRIKILKPLSSIKAGVEFMVCDDANCLPPDTVDLMFIFSENTGSTEANQTQSVDNSNAGIFSLEGDDKTPNDKTVKEETQKVEENDNKNVANKGLWSIFFISFLSGFAALLTPCVFPMIPMTVSYFTKQSKSKIKGIRNAIFYGLSIIVIYVVLGSVVTAIFGADALNALASNFWFNIIFFLILIFFAASFLGAFELTLPSSWSTKVDAQADRSGLVGIFFMALALAIVSFSCTGPIVGTLLVEAASKGGIAPIIGMLGFSLAIALPFAIFAAFPGWLNSLPKSGGWLNTVKVVLGFLELALAFKFLSNADLAYQYHWLEREVFIAIWIAVFGTLALYLFGKIRLPHDSPVDKISVGRLSLGLLSLTFTIYMIPGLWGAPLNLISAFPPPQHYSESPYGVGYTKTGGIVSSQEDRLPEGAHLLEPHNILAFDDYETGIAYAKKVNKPILLDFTGWTCVNCRKMEQNVWAKPHILDILKNDVVLISLYVDDKRPLPENQIVESKLKPGKQIKYIGQKWSEFQTVRYKANSQPFYVLMNHDESNLIDPIGYTPDVDEFHQWLTKGVGAFK
ncbi:MULTISPECIES: protein-disulfide reductase DsbD family protein [Capnocytophaga]|uniref:protein-disulfide reductase DsbD family protein n=1 Tax=Capnocytophaga TaxID=1016 RepID=UPI000BB1F27C|nr:MULTISPECIES: cytochrome c biogenesis protein CcdA [Capnocytophaga]ATA73707.1 thiol:disulfide interchange protein [Capnocytophaga sp. H4358]ATA75854.1 thiol:disulfide interchange protein [Capnocytophaga sp. H2931]GIM60377.1 thiol:disulfide interchange protein DsbD [Capnocytophaga canis]